MCCTADELRITVSQECPPTVALSGSADFYTKECITGAFDELINEGCIHIRADCSEIGYMDSSALAAFIGCAIKASKAGGGIELVGASDRITRMLILCGAVTFFKASASAISLFRDDAPIQPLDDFWQVSSFSIFATPEAAAKVRQRLAVVMDSLPLSTHEKQDVLVAAGEAISNAIKHGCACNPELKLSIECVASASQLAIDVTDPGPGFDYSGLQLSMPEMVLDRGMGIYLMCRCVDEVSFCFENGTRVRLVKRIGG